VILLIDDDPDFGAIVLEINRRLGMKTLLAGSAAEALKLLHTYRPAGILLDLGLPDMDGNDLLHEIKSSREFASIPVYVISARDREEANGRHPIVGYLQKPVDEEQIAKAEALLLSSGALAADGSILVAGSGGIDAGTIAELFPSQLRPATVREVASSEYEEALSQQSWRLVVIDLTGVSIPDALRMASAAQESQAALLFFSKRAVSEEDEAQLRRFSDSIIVKTLLAEKRLLQEMERFLRQVPGSEKHAESHPLQPGNIRQLEGKRILVVDDDPRNLFVITSALEESGARVVNAVNGQKALELLDTEPFALMITDIMMPVMDGFQLIEAVRSNPERERLPIITLTAKAMPQDREKALAMGSSDFLTKPVDYNVLVNLAALWASKGA
jgi:CheY-like chemotaxis protein